MSVAAEITPALPKPGLYSNLTRSTYESLRAINVSTLEKFELSAAHAREAMTHPKAPTSAMDFGTAAHCAVLEPLRFARDYIAAPKVDRRTKVGKEAWSEFEAAHADKIAVAADEFIAIQRIREAAWSHPVAKQLLVSKGLNEVGAVWEDEETGILCKGLIDRIGTFDGWTWILDVKTCVDASQRGFARACRNLHYGAKAAFYFDGCNAVAQRERRFCWIAIEKEPPYAIAIYEADDSALNAGRNKYRRWLRLYQEAIETNTWPGYEPVIQPLGSEQTEWYA